MTNLTRSSTLLSLPAIFLLSCTMAKPKDPVTKDEAAKLAHRIEYSAARHDYTLLNNIFDEKEMTRRISEEGGISMSRSVVKSGFEGFQQGQFGKAVIDALGKDGSYELIKQYEKGGSQHLLFRLNGDGGINYHDYELVKNDESVRAADVFIYMSGENVSKTIADALQLTNQNIPKEDLEKVNMIKTIKSEMAQNHFETAKKRFDELPPAIKKEKAYQLINIRICSKLDSDKYTQALDEYRALFPNDPNMYLMMVDVYVLRKDYPMALDAVNKLDSFINKDPYQDYERGLIYLLMKDTVKAEQCLERLHTNMPKLSKGTLELMETYYYTHNADKAADLIKTAKDSGLLNQEALAVAYALHPELGHATEAGKVKEK